MKQSKSNAQSGFSLIEFLVVAIIGGIVLVSALKYYSVLSIQHQREQQRSMVERSLASIHESIGNHIVGMAGRELQAYNGTIFGSATTMPTNGNAGSQPLPIDFITPYKVNGNDAISVLYGSRTVSRMEVVQPTSASSSTIVATSTDTTATNYSVGQLMLLVGSQPQAANTVTNNAPIVARLVKLTRRPYRTTITIAAGSSGGPHIVGQPAPPSNPAITIDALTFEIDWLTSATAAPQFPALQNATANQIFDEGSVLVPVTMVSFYLGTSSTGVTRIIRNTDGSIIPDASGTGWQIQGGSEDIVGEADSLAINYILNDNSIQPTPATPAVSWLHQVMGINIGISRTVQLPWNETLTRSVNAVYPIVAREMEN